MSDQETGKEKNYYARAAWTLFLISVAVFVVIHKLDLAPFDLTGWIWLVALICVVVSVVVYSCMEKRSWRTFSRVYAKMVCPLFFVITLCTLFIAWPLDNAEIVHPRGNPFQTQEVKGISIYNPFTSKVVGYKLTYVVSCDSVAVKYEFTGTPLDFHYMYGEDGAWIFQDRADSAITAVIKEFVGQNPKVQRYLLLCYLHHELPGGLPPYTKYSDQIWIIGGAKHWGPVGSPEG